MDSPPNDNVHAGFYPVSVFVPSPAVTQPNIYYLHQKESVFDKSIFVF